MSNERDSLNEFPFARALEGAAQGLGVHETLDALLDQDVNLTEGCRAVCDVAAEMYEQGIERDDLDPSWIRLRDWIESTGGRA